MELKLYWGVWSLIRYPAILFYGYRETGSSLGKMPRLMQHRHRPSALCSIIGRKGSPVKRPALTGRSRPALLPITLLSVNRVVPVPAAARALGVRVLPFACRFTTGSAARSMTRGSGQFRRCCAVQSARWLVSAVWPRGSAARWGAAGSRIPVRGAVATRLAGAAAMVDRWHVRLLGLDSVQLQVVSLVVLAVGHAWDVQRPPDRADDNGSVEDARGPRGDRAGRQTQPPRDAPVRRADRRPNHQSWRWSTTWR